MREARQYKRDRRGQFASTGGPAGRREAFEQSTAGIAGTRDVHSVGMLPKRIVGQWTADTKGNQTVVITGERRQHYLATPEMHQHEGRSVAPCHLTVHRNRTDRDVAIFYGKLSGDTYVQWRCACR
ncbi:MAG: hypothetical protein U0531_07865 [Dehalococcoidia bacterium]